MNPDYARIVRSWVGLKVLVAGDAMLDTYHFGRVDRISPEAPVPVFIEDDSRCEVRRGGADNVAHQLEVWGARVETLFAKVRSVKHRYLVGHHQVFRMDRDSSEACDLVAIAELSDPDVIVLSDYGKGFLTPEVCQALIQSAGDIPVVVDPKGRDWSKYADATVICPNELEYADRIGLVPHRLILKRGGHGIDVIENGKMFHVEPHVVPVFDVTGAGDTVVAAISATLGRGGGSLTIAAQIACAAASVVVQKVGTSVCSVQELLCALGSPVDAMTDFMPVIGTSLRPAVQGAITSSSRLIPMPTAGE